MAYNLDEIFKMVMSDEDKVIIEVMADTPLKTAMYPFVSGEYKYLTLTRGRHHILTIVDKDNTTFAFGWGCKGDTCVSERLRLLKANVLQFVKDNNILINCSNPTSAIITYCDNEYTLSIFDDNRDSFDNYDGKATDLDSMIAEVSKFVTADSWEFVDYEADRYFNTKTWRAVNPTFK